MSMLNVQDLRKVYKPRFGQAVEALRKVNFQVQEGEFVAIMGDSGSGKTTLLNIISGLDRQTEGLVLIDGIDTRQISDDKLAEFRRDKLGYVFQDFKLLENLSLKDNMALPLVLAKRPVAEIEAKMEELAQSLGLVDLIHKYPYELSGGEKQRVAIGRALANEPALLLADEPTGQLDSRTSEEILELFREIHASGQTIIMVSHSVRAAAYASRTLFIRDGIVFAEAYKQDRTNLEQMDELSRIMAEVYQVGQARMAQPARRA